jgi:protein gp37
MARRFGGEIVDAAGGRVATIRGEAAEERKIHDLDAPTVKLTRQQGEVASAYPYGFDPTFHRYRLGIPQMWKKPQNIFVCSMADLFGEWVPDEWIAEVFATCAKAPQHRYLFLTKNPARYERLAGMLAPPDMWLGITITSGFQKTTTMRVPDNIKTFLSIEPLQDAFMGKGFTADLIIIGAETGNRKGKIIPRRRWIDDICAQADKASVPVFMKDSLTPIVGEANMRRDLPWKGDKQ